MVVKNGVGERSFIAMLNSIIYYSTRLAGRGERGGGGRKGRRRLDDSLDDDKCLPQPRMARPAHNIPSLSSESSLSGSETRGKEEEVEEEEGEEEKGEEGDERSNIERNKSESDRLCSVSESGVRSKLSGCGKSLLADGATTRISGKTKGELQFMNTTTASFVVLSVA